MFTRHACFGVVEVPQNSPVLHCPKLWGIQSLAKFPYKLPYNIVDFSTTLPFEADCFPPCRAGGAMQAHHSNLRSWQAGGLLATTLNLSFLLQYSHLPKSPFSLQHKPSLQDSLSFFLALLTWGLVVELGQVVPASLLKQKHGHLCWLFSSSEAYWYTISEAAEGSLTICAQLSLHGGLWGPNYNSSVSCYPPHLRV